MPTFLKLLVMGLPSSGKTTFIKNVFEKKEFSEFEEYRPTVGVGVSLYEFKGSEGVMVSSFDCGGQTSFIDTYMTDQWIPMLFGKVSIFLFMVDSSSRDNLENAAKLFHKYHENLKRNSPDSEIYILATKWDKHTLTEKELRGAFRDNVILSISVFDATASEVTTDIIEGLLKKKREAEGS
jgi:GTPase SAR1 family protein